MSNEDLLKGVVDPVNMREVTSQHDFGFVGEDVNFSPTRNVPGFKQTTNFTPKYSTADIEKKGKKKNLISKFFSDMSRLGMTYDDKVIENMRAIPADKSMLPKDEQLLNSDLFNGMLSSWKKKADKDKNFFEKDYQAKREALRSLATQPELEDILDTMTNECVVYDSMYTYFLEPYFNPQDMNDFSPDMQTKINTSMTNGFRALYKMLEWKTRAWDDFKRWLIEGILAFEIVYDSLNNPTKIIGIIPVDPVTLTRKFENNKWYWIQYKDVMGKERKLLDNQIIYIEYQDTRAISRVSYLERLVRPFNVYRIIEQAQIIWTVTNAQYKLKFSIPTKGASRANAAQMVASAMNRYKEDIKFIQDTGELTINGKTNLPFNKEYWMPNGDDGSPEIDVIGNEGPELNDCDQIKYFKNYLYKVSKIPLSRFDQESGESWFGADASSYARTEIDFARFVHRLRNTFAQIIIKPLQLQIALDVPELRENRMFLNSLQMEWKSYNLFEELMEIELMQKRVEHIQTMKESLVDMTADGSEVSFFSSEFLVKKYLKLSEADLKLNNELKKKELEEFNLAGSEDSGSGYESLDADELADILNEAHNVVARRAKKQVKKRRKKNEEPRFVNDDEE